MELTTETVWGRRQLVGKEISPAAYNLTIGLVLAWGFLANYLMVQAIPAEAVLGINRWVFLGGYIACIFGGTWIYSASDNPVVSFGGYNLIVVPLGLVLVRLLYFVDSGVITDAFMATGLITASMMIVSAMFPSFFLSIGRGLFVAFVVAFIVEIAIAVFTGSIPPVFDWVFVMIFSGYIGYDWARAQALPKTYDNAVDAAAALYVDIVILFIRLVRIMSRR